MAPLPRPILKRTASAPSTPKHVVHFPPSPALTRTFVAHSSAAYDRSPIVVAPNACALPERGGRTYILDDPAVSPAALPRRSPSKSSRVMHPRAPGDIPSCFAPIPSLIPDTSESEDSDGFPSPNLENQEFFFGLPSSHGLKPADDAPSALSFLPHAPSLPYYPSSEDCVQPVKPVRRKARKHDTPRDDNRIQNPSDNEEEEAIPRRKPLKKRPSYVPSSASTFTPALSLCDSFSSFGLRDDGCLGGF